MKVRVSNSASAGGPFGVTSASAGCSDLEEEYEGMPVLPFSEAGDYSSEGESEDEAGTGFGGSFKPVASTRVENHYPANDPLLGVVLSAAAGVTPLWSLVR